MESRKKWMLSGVSNDCKIVVDFGAANALLQGKSSLLPAGISEVVGVCKRGDIISIENMNGKPIACKPDDAIQLLKNSELDKLVIGNEVIE